MGPATYAMIRRKRKLVEPFFLDAPAPKAERLDAVCVRCKRQRGQHQATTLNCPWGLRTRIGYIHFHDDQVFMHRSQLKGEQK